MEKKVTILGSTGSIGVQAIEVIEKLQGGFEVLALSAGSNIAVLKEQIAKLNPKTVCVKNEEDIEPLSAEFPKTKFLFGEKGLLELCSNKKNDIILVAVSGKIGLKPTIEAIKNGIDIALANKETLVMAGTLVMSLAKEHNVNILPVDSEHSAIHQCMKDIAEVKRLLITASGGPFRDKSVEEMKSATLNQTLAHPRWSMGKKITVDSATLMNKGLEVIEAYHLFGIDPKNIKVVIHPQSVIHSAIEYNDGSVIAQMGEPSMHIPIQYALTHPKRVEGIKTDSFSFFENPTLTFEKPNLDKFPCLALAFKALKLGQSYPVILNAANEVAVFAFLEGKIGLTDISIIVKKAMDNHKPIENPTIEQILKIDKIQRLKTKKLISEWSVKQDEPID